MPEGPEVRRERDRVARAVEGTAVSVELVPERLRRHRARLDGRRVEAVEARGKALLVRFEGGRVLYSHNQLYGRWTTAAAGATPRTNRSLRVRLENGRRAALLWSASEVAVLTEGSLPRHPYLARLGPDVLNGGLDADAVRAHLDDRRFARRALGGLLLDQGFLAGVGNYLRSEVLFGAGLLPDHRLGALDDAERRALATSVVTTIRRAYRQRGATTAPDLLADLKASGATWRDRRHHVFGRDGRPCHACGARVERREVAGRRLYTCPDCQA